MREVIDYRIVYERREQDLENEVRKLIREGWQPFGGVSQMYWNPGMQYAQAMVRYLQEIT